jgi:hypothetical protein
VRRGDTGALMFQADAFQNDAFLTDDTLPVPLTPRPSGGLPLTFKEWARRQPRDEQEDAPPKPRVVEKIGVAQPRTETKAFTPSPPIETGLSELTRSQIRRRAKEARRRRLDDEWFLLN